MSKKLQKVVSVATSITTILWISGIGALAPMAASAAVAGIAEGDTIKVANNPDVYIAKYVGSKAFKRLILNPQVFNSYGHLSWSKIKTVSQADLDQFTTSDLVRALGDTKVYKLTPNGDVGTKQWVNVTAEQFTALGNDWDSIYVINNTDRDNYTTGSDITGGTATPTPSTSAGAVTVSLASDTPAAGVAVEGAARVPFTKVNFTAGSEAATITGLTVQRVGLADDLAIASLVLIDQDGNQVGLSQTLNSSHQVVFNETLTIPANTTKTYTLAANMAATLDTFAGQIASLSLVSVTTGGSLSGVLPITGNGQTINATLAIGTATITAGAFDPVTAATKNVGTTSYNFSSVKITAGSAEDITVTSIRWNQSGSAATSDLANVKVSDGTTDYATTVSSDGKYYTASFGSGILIGKGLNKDFTIKGDIVNGSARTISFDVYRTTDIVVKGNTFGYFMTPTFTANGVANTSANTFIQAAASPFFGGSNVTVGGGSLRVDKSATGAPSANIVRGATAQVLGAFDFVVQGEPVNVSSIRLEFDHTGVGSTTDITTVTLNKADGTVLSTGGTPGDDTTVHAATLDGTEDGHVNFSGTITFPVGTTQIIVKGNLNTDFVANNTFRTGFSLATGGPGGTVTSIVGATTGNAITATPATAVWGNTMTIQGGSLTANISGTPVAQNVIAGTTGHTFSNIVFDASASGEDVKVTQVVLRNAFTAVGDVFGMQLFDGSTPLNTGSNVVNPSDPAAAGSPLTFTFTLDTPLVITKGTQKTIAVKGNILANATATDTQNWGFSAATTNVTAIGVSTGQTITVTTTLQAGSTMTITASGQWSVALDSSTPAARLIAANTTGNTVTALRFRATAEQINITKIRLSLSAASSSVLVAGTGTFTASSTANDVAKVYVYDQDGTLLNTGGSVLGVGNAAAGSANASSTISFSTPLVLPANQDRVVTIKADIASMDDTSNPTAISGHQLAIDFFGSTSTAENEATGMSSGVKIANFSGNTAQANAYIYRSVPTLSKLDVSTTKLTNSTMDLLKFRVAADAKGDIDIYKFTFRIATSVATVNALTLVDVTTGGEVTLYASSTSPVSGGATSATDLDVVLMASPGTPGGTATPRRVSAGSFRDFVVRGTITGATTNATVVTQLQGDADLVQPGGTFMSAAATLDANLTNNDFIWSDLSAAAHAITTSDWTNGFLVSGLPSSNMVGQTLSF